MKVNIIRLMSHKPPSFVLLAWRGLLITQHSTLSGIFFVATQANRAGEFTNCFFFCISSHVLVVDSYSSPFSPKQLAMVTELVRVGMQCSKLRPVNRQFPVKPCTCLDIIKFDRPKCPFKVPWCLASVRDRLAILQYRL